MIVECIDLVMAPGDGTLRLKSVAQIVEPDLLADRLWDGLLLSSRPSFCFCYHCYLNVISVYVDVLKYEAAEGEAAAAAA
jgi:hypothetical protein